MPSVLNPYVNFEGTARQALAFYATVFGGTPTVLTFSEGGMPGPDADRVMHGQLDTVNGFTLMCADTPTGRERTAMGNSMAISVSGTDGEELRGYWKGLSAGGAVRMPLAVQIWGDEFGMCTDQFGVDWMININQSDAPPR